jgi:hypothetical protein
MKPDDDKRRPAETGADSSFEAWHAELITQQAEGADQSDLRSRSFSEPARGSIDDFRYGVKPNA